MQNSYKAPDGKLIRITLELEGKFIRSLQISGDFFLHPEEKIEQIESSLINEEINKDEIIQKIKKIVEDEDITLVGITPEDIAEAIIGCVKNNRCEK